MYQLETISLRFGVAILFLLAGLSPLQAQTDKSKTTNNTSSTSKSSGSSSSSSKSSSSSTSKSSGSSSSAGQNRSSNSGLNLNKARDTVDRVRLSDAPQVRTSTTTHTQVSQEQNKVERSSQGAFSRFLHLDKPKKPIPSPGK